MLVVMQSDVASADTESPAAPTRSVAWRRTRIATIAFAATMCAVLLGGGVDAFWLEARLDHFSVSLPDDGPGSTWLLIGSDAFPNPHASPRFAGSRADVILLVHVGPPHASVISVPRDLLLVNEVGGVERAALTLDSGGSQELVNGLCRTLGVAAGHVALLTRDGFASIVDAAGGVTVHVSNPVRDPSVDLDIEDSGTVHLAGRQALALVRSRHPQYLIDGTWRRLHEHAGARARARNAGAVFDALRRQAGELNANPFRLQRVLWAVTGALRVDSGTGLTDLIGMLHGTGRLRVLPAARLPRTIAVLTDDRTRAVLTAAGYPGTCTPPG
jgi:LCP family protein required for cell wall assembly